MIPEQRGDILKFVFGLILLSVLAFQTAFADNQPRVGRNAAAKYFEKREPAQDDGNGNSGGATDHYLALHFGRYMGSQAYEWGMHGKETGVGGNTYGLTYRVDQWANSMDLNLRVDFQEYNAADEKPTKLSLMPLLTFPDASSKFPLYFGIGAGLGVFFKQIADESPLSLDYQLVIGARFFNVFENTGFFIESGIKNHIQIFTSGQLNGTFLAGGAVFTF